MSNLKEIVEGSINGIAQETIDENTYYNIDMADGGITNAQMADAIAHPELFNAGDVYMCVDSGTYTEKHFYKFTGSAWADVTREYVLTGASDPTNATVGFVGQFYLNTTTPKLFQCTAITSGTPNTYTWSEVGGGTMYLHYIKLGSYPLVTRLVNITTSSSTQFTKSTLAQWLYNKGYNTVDSLYPALTTSTNRFEFGIYSTNGTNILSLRLNKSNKTITVDNVAYSLASFTDGSGEITDLISDTVTQL